MLRRSLLSLLLVVSVAQAQVPPDRALSTFKVVDGLELSLFASETPFTDPAPYRAERF